MEYSIPFPIPHTHHHDRLTLSFVPYKDRFHQRLAPQNLRHLRTLKLLCVSFLKHLRSDMDVGVEGSHDTIDGDTGGSHGGGKTSASFQNHPGSTPGGTVKTLNDFLFECGCDAVNVFSLTRWLRESKIAHKIAGYAESRFSATDEQGGNELGNLPHRDAWDGWGDDSLGFGATTLSRSLLCGTGAEKSNKPSVGSVHAVSAFVTALASADTDGRVLVEKETIVTVPSVGTSTPSVSSELKGGFKAVARSRGSDGGRLKFVLLDAAARFKSVVDTAKAVVLVGGTLSPIHELARSLFPNAEMIVAAGGTGTCTEGTDGTDTKVTDGTTKGTDGTNTGTGTKTEGTTEGTKGTTKGTDGTTTGTSTGTTGAPNGTTTGTTGLPNGTTTGTTGIPTTLAGTPPDLPLPELVPKPKPKQVSTISCGHVVPIDALLPLAVRCGPSGKVLDFSFKSRFELGMMVSNRAVSKL